MEEQQANPNPKARLYAKIANVMADVKRVEKRGRNDHFKYDFVTAEDVKDLVRPLLAKHGLALLPTIEGMERETKGNQVLTRLTVSFTLACGETGETVTSLWHGEALDNQDKGINKALTAVLKYYLINTFQVSTGDEADPDAGQGTPQSAPASGEITKEILKFYRQLQPEARKEDGEILELLFDWACGKGSPFSQENAVRVLARLSAKALEALRDNGRKQDAIEAEYQEAEAVA